MERDCGIDISGYDILRLCVSMPDAMKCRISCTIDGIKSTVTEFQGINQRYEFDAGVQGKTLESVQIEFMTLKDEPATATLYWLGLANSKKQEERNHIGEHTK